MASALVPWKFVWFLTHFNNVAIETELKVSLELPITWQYYLGTLQIKPILCFSLYEDRHIMTNEPFSQKK